MSYFISKKIENITEKLEKHGFEAYLVGGCVRDLVMGEKDPKDWDITTNATPEEILKIFPHTHYENNFGTVAIVIDEEPEESPFRIVEITPYRLEEKYSDARRPDSVTFTKNIEDDLGRRDFTMNALALSVSNKNTHNKGVIFDPFNGLVDIENRVIQAVGNPIDRFSEDALRMLRAVRFASELDFKINNERTKVNLEVDDGKTYEFIANEENGKLNIYESEENEAQATYESILHLCNTSFPKKYLSWHYRSKHESLIAVSNQEFYENRLVIYPSPVNDIDNLGLKLIHLPDTVYDRGKSRMNRMEAIGIHVIWKATGAANARYKGIIFFFYTHNRQCFLHIGQY